MAATQLVTAFTIRQSRGRAVLDDLIGGPPGIPTTDRYPAYDHLSADARPVCGAHLRRDFQATIDRANAGTFGGEDLLTYADIALGHPKRVRDGTLSRNGFRRRHLRWLRPAVRDLLEVGAGCGCAATAAVCRNLLVIEPTLWTESRRGRRRADPQRGGAGFAARGLPAQDQLRHRLGRRQPVR